MRQKTRPEVGHSGSSVGKKMNSIFFFGFNTAPFG